MARVPAGQGFSIFYRTGWWIQYGLMHVYGPAHLDSRRDPRTTMRAEYQHRKDLAAARKRS